MCRHARRLAGRPRRAVRVLGAGRPALARALPARVAAHPDGAELHRLRRRPRRGRRESTCPSRTPSRPVDIVYRARNLPFHIGHHGQLKHEIAGIVDTAARARGLRTDISTDIRDTKYGDAWAEFLASGRCVIGTESGVQRARSRGRHPPLRGRVAAVAPGRHLRAVLGAAGAGLGRLRLHGHQPAALRGGSDEDLPAPRRRRLRRHPRARDALHPAAPRLLEPAPRRSSASRDPAETEAMAERAWDDLIASGRYSYGAFAAHVESVVDELAGGRVRSGGHRSAASWSALNAGSDALCRAPHPHARGSPTAPRCATPRGPRTPWCAGGTPCGGEPPDDRPRRCGRPAARARSRSAARHGGCSCSTSTLRRAPCARRCARRCACWSPAPRATRSSTGTPATACRGRSGGCRVDAIILDNTLLVARWAPEFAARRPTFDWLAGLDALKIAFPQDEYNHAHVLDDWLADLGIDVVFSVFGPEHRGLLYPRLGATARFEKCLTGYVDEARRDPQRGRRAAPRPPRARPRVPRAGPDAALRAPRPAQAHRRRGGGPGGPRRGPARRRLDRPARCGAG